MHIEDGQTKDRIIMLLKKKGGLTTGELSRQIGITSMGVRQHLRALERRNLIDYEARKNGIGRPIFVYKLTGIADDIFPKDYPGFMLGLLSDLEAMDGNGKIDALFRKRKERLLKEMGQLLAPYDFDDRVGMLSQLYEKDGYFVELENNAQNYILNLYNCPFLKISDRYKEACICETELFSGLLNRPVIMEKAASTGDAFCSIRIERDK